jgi:hypothetical protein
MMITQLYSKNIPYPPQVIYSKVKLQHIVKKNIVFAFNTIESVYFCHHHPGTILFLNQFYLYPKPVNFRRNR